MRYVGKDDFSIYLKCGHCKKVHSYKKEQLEKRTGVCAVCKKPYRMIFFLPLKPKKIISWLPPVFMALFSILIVFLLSYPPLLKQYQFNRIVTTSNSLFTSIFIPILGTVISLLPSLPCFKSENFKLNQIAPLLLILAESITLIFIMNNVIEARYNSLSIIDQESKESRQYFGSATGEYATGSGRLFDNQGNLVYYGHFSNNLYDGYGEKYEPVNTVHNDSSLRSYQCVYEGYFKKGMASGQGREYRYDAEYTFEKEEKESSYLYYQGEFLEGEYCGHGTLYGIDSKYQGGFFKGIYNGYGNEWFLDSDNSKVYRMEGYFSNGKLNGKGTKYFPNGQVLFIGDYTDGQGTNGIFYFESGTVKYEGELSNSEYEGQGKLYWENGNLCYDGQWKNGNREGRGTGYTEEGLTIYTGEWKEGQYSGYGTSYYEDGETPYYTGRWENGKWQGVGTQYYKNKNPLYESEWKEGQLDGDTSYYWENGNLCFTGNCSLGKKHGKGIEYWENGNIAYEGEWVDDQRSGEGAWYWPNGQLFFEGHFENNEIEGYGQTFSKDGTLLYEGYFSNGKYHGTGTSYWPNGTIQYTGQWLNAEYSGEGKEYDENGELLHEGQFLEGSFISEK